MLLGNITIKWTIGLTLSAPCISENRVKIKINLNAFIFTHLCGASKGFMKAFKAFIKPFESPQRSPGLGRDELKWIKYFTFSFNVTSDKVKICTSLAGFKKLNAYEIV